MDTFLLFLMKRNLIIIISSKSLNDLNEVERCVRICSVCDYRYSSIEIHFVSLLPLSFAEKDAFTPGPQSVSSLKNVVLMLF